METRYEVTAMLRGRSQILLAQTRWPRAAALTIADSVKESEWSLMSLCSLLKIHSPMSGPQVEWARDICSCPG